MAGEGPRWDKRQAELVRGQTTKAFFVRQCRKFWVKGKPRTHIRQECERMQFHLKHSPAALRTMNCTGKEQKGDRQEVETWVGGDGDSRGRVLGHFGVSQQALMVDWMWG